MMKTFHKEYGYRFFITMLLFCVFPAVLLSSCVNESASNNSSGYGSVALSIRIFSESNSQPDASARRHEMDVDPSCQVHVEIMDSSSTIIASGGPWDWSDGSGTVTGVPVGSDRTIAVKINDPADSVLQYEGEISGITISSGANDLTGSPIYVYSLTDGCADFSGYWYSTEYPSSSDSYCSGDGSVSNYATFVQDGCDVTFNVEGFTGSSVGYVEGNTLTIDPPVTFTYGYESTTYSNWTIVINGDNFTGSASWAYTDSYYGESCTGTSTFSGTRESS